MLIIYPKLAAWTSNLLSKIQLCYEDEKDAFTVGSIIIIKSKQKIQVIKPSKELGNNWAIELGMTNPRPLQHAVIQSLKKTNGLQRQNSHSRLKGVVQFATGGQVSFWVAFLLLSGRGLVLPSMHPLHTERLGFTLVFALWSWCWCWCWCCTRERFTLGASRWSWLHRIVSPAPARLVQLHCRSRWALSAATATTPPELLLQLGLVVCCQG